MKIVTPEFRRNLANKRRTEYGLEVSFDEYQLFQFVPYKCRNCGTVLCAECAKVSICPRCGQNIFDLIERYPFIN